MRLPPLAALRVPELECRDAGPRHAQVARIHNVPGLAVQGGVGRRGRSDAEPKDGKDRRVDAQRHGDELRATFLIRACKGAEKRGPCLAGFVPAVHRLRG